MCGIAGFSGQFNLDLLKNMGARLLHRGPDDAGEIILSQQNNLVGLAHQRLSIIDLSAEGRQPMTINCDCCGNTLGMPTENKRWLTYNGEIYNHQTLRRELEAKGHHFFSQTDSEVILHLYAEHGVNLLQQLNGIFAFALYDGQTGQLFLARDGVGIKPLYYSQQPAGFLFASEIKALLAYSELPRQLDRVALHYYLAYLWCPGEQTALHTVKKVQPGEALIVRNGQIEKRWFFYDLPYQGVSLQASPAEISFELEKKLMQAVERQLIADVPVGAFLSGGLDSSAIVAMMRKLNPHARIQCYTIDGGDEKYIEGNPNDLPYAKQVAAHLQVDLHVVEIQADLMQHMTNMLYHLDEPQADPAPINVLLIAEAARRDGIKVLLSGAGGDDIFSGYRRHHALLSERFFAWLPLAIKNKLSLFSCHLLEGNSTKYNMQFAFLRRMAKLFAYCHLPTDQRLASYFLWGTENLRTSLYSQEMANHLSQANTLAPLLQSLHRIPQESAPLNRLLYLEGKHFLADHNLNYTDKMSMAAGVEVRTPLLDSDLIDFATRIPVHLKQKGKIGKYIFKKTMESYLPNNVIYRPKSGFSMPLRRWLHRELQPMVNEVLSASAINARGIFDANAITRLIKLDQAGRVDAAYTIYSVLCIELWCRAFIDGN